MQLAGTIAFRTDNRSGDYPSSLPTSMLLGHAADVIGCAVPDLVRLLRAVVHAA
jgi:hypothetical protein